jgi:hypothetical protein
MMCDKRYLLQIGQKRAVSSNNVLSESDSWLTPYDWENFTIKHPSIAIAGHWLIRPRHACSKQGS